MPDVVTDPSGDVPKKALVIGNAKYVNLPVLDNPGNDAEAIAAQLRAIGFDVTLLTNAKFDELLTDFGSFLDSCGKLYKDHGKVVGLIYYAGHGIQIKGENYLLPVDAQIRYEADLQKTLNLNGMLESFNKVSEITLVILDCCRTNPLPRNIPLAEATRGFSNGMAPLRAQTQGAFVAFATAPDTVALDGLVSQNSPFTEALTHYIAKPFPSISDLMIAVRRLVWEKTARRQIPWDHSWLLSPFTFVGTPKDGPTEAVRESEYWAVVQESDDPAVVRGFISEFPSSPRKQTAIERMEYLVKRKWTRRLFAGVGAAAVALAIGVFGYVGLKWSSFHPLPADYDLVGGDIFLDITTPSKADKSVAKNPIEICRWRCATDTRCVAFNVETNNTNGSSYCYQKSEVLFRLKNQNTTKSILYSEFSSWAQAPIDSPFVIYWDHDLEGDEVQPEKIPLRNLGTRKSGEHFFKTIDQLDCMNACSGLGNDCQGFSYTAIYGKCSLFKSVKFPKRDNLGKCTSHPSEYSGVTKAVDNELHKQHLDCPPEK